MRWFTRVSDRVVPRGKEPGRRARRAVLEAELLEGRQLLSTVTAGTSNGFYAIDNVGSVFHYQDNGGLVKTNLVGFNSLVVGHDPYGREELFAHGNDNSIWEIDGGVSRRVALNFSSTIVAGANGFYAIDNIGNVFHYQDNGGLVSSGLYGFNGLVVGHDPYGREELFAHGRDNTIWEQDAGVNRRVALNFSSAIVAGANGFYAIDNIGNVFHYQDNGGLVSSGLYGFNGLVVGHDPYGREELFAHGRDNTIWERDAGVNRRVALNFSSTIVAGANGFYAIDNIGNVFHYQDNGGLVSSGLYGFNDLSVSHDPYGREELFAHGRDNTIWEQDAGVNRRVALNFR